MKKYIPYTIASIILIYLVPYIISQTPVISGITEMVSLILLIFFITIISLLYGRKNGFSLLLMVIIALAFLSYGLIFSYAPFRIIFYLVLYAISSIIGNLLGLMFRKKERKKEK